jgi:hypothetical protein
MKILDWQNFFSEQRARHGKVIFSTAELANASRTERHAVNTELGRLVKRGMVRRYAQGKYGPTEGVEVEDIVAAIDPGAYVTGFYALFRHHLVTQAPMEITCFTNRRHNRTAGPGTSGGKLWFVRVPAVIYAKPAGQVLAPVEQALCDYAWLSLRDGIHPRSQVTFRNLDSLNRRRLLKDMRRYPEPVRIAVAGIVGGDSVCHF